jgi:predicted helicase
LPGRFGNRQKQAWGRAFNHFASEFSGDLNDGMTAAAVTEILAQQLITMPVVDPRFQMTTLPGHTMPLSSDSISEGELKIHCLLVMEHSHLI